MLYQCKTHNQWKQQLSYCNVSLDGQLYNNASAILVSILLGIIMPGSGMLKNYLVIIQVINVFKELPDKQPNTVAIVLMRLLNRTNQ